jgi:xanthine dehydrogenase YagS FAD-binding subunit
MMPPFEYVRARSVDEAIAHLARGNARIHAGGTDLLGCIRERTFSVERIVSIRGIKGLSGINETPEGVSVGSLTTITQLASSPVIARLFPSLAMAAGEWRALSFETRVQSGEISAKNHAAGTIAASSIA